MSAKAAGRVWDLDLPHNKQHVLLAMADHADHEGRNMYPSLDLIAWKTGYSYRQVRRIVEELERDGILVMRKPARQQHPAVYDMDLSAGTAKPAFDRTARKKNGQNVHPENGQNVHPDKSRVDISTPPEWTSEHARVDIAMSTKPWNHGDQPSSPTQPERSHGDDGDRKRARVALRACGLYNGSIRQILALGIDTPTLIASAEYLRNEGWGPGAIADELRDNPPAPGVPYARARAVAQPAPPPAPVAGLSPEQLRGLKDKHDYTRHS